MSLTTNDLKLIKEVMKITIDEELDLKLDEKLKYLPSTEVFFDREDKIMGELKAFREEMTILSGLHHKVNDHEERIEKIEEALDIQPAI